jgi:hypothetical protein
MDRKQMAQELSRILRKIMMTLSQMAQNVGLG